MKEFNKYLKEARQEFCQEVNKYNVSDNLQLRTACDSFLIAFDQAYEKAINYTHCCETVEEEEGKHIFKVDLNTKKAQTNRREQIDKILSAPCKVYLYKDGHYVQIKP